MENLYNVIFDGEIKKGENLDNVKNKLSSLFNRKGDTNINAIFCGKPVIIKRNTDYDTATKFCHYFSKCGAVLKINNVPSTDVKSVKKLSTSENLNQHHDMKRSDDLKECPYCGEQIKAIAKKCRYCDEILDPSIRKGKIRERDGTPVGKIRTPIIVIFLIIVTLGIYGLVWIYKTHNEIKKHTKEEHEISPGLALGLMFIPLFGLIWFPYIMYKLIEKLNVLQRKNRYTEICDPGWVVFWFYAGILIPFGVFVAPWLVQNSLNTRWRDHKSGGDVSKRNLMNKKYGSPTSSFGWGLFLFLPGLFAFIGKVSEETKTSEDPSLFGILFWLILGAYLIIRGWNRRS